MIVLFVAIIMVAYIIHNIKIKNDKFDEWIKASHENRKTFDDLTGKTYLTDNGHQAIYAVNKYGDHVIKDVETQEVVYNSNTKERLKEIEKHEAYLKDEEESGKLFAIYLPNSIYKSFYIDYFKERCNVLGTFYVLFEDGSINIKSYNGYIFDIFIGIQDGIAKARYNKERNVNLFDEDIERLRTMYECTFNKYYLETFKIEDYHSAEDWIVAIRSFVLKKGTEFDDILSLYGRFIDKYTNIYWAKDGYIDYNAEQEKKRLNKKLKKAKREWAKDIDAINSGTFKYNKSVYETVEDILEEVNFEHKYEIEEIENCIRRYDKDIERTLKSIQVKKAKKEADFKKLYEQYIEVINEDYVGNLIKERKKVLSRKE